MRGVVSDTSRNASGARGRISESALGLFLRNGFARTGVREIAAAAGVSVGSVFNHFENKEEILYSLISQMQDKVAPMVQEAADACRSRIDDPGQSVEVALLSLTAEYAAAVDLWRRHIVLSYQESHWLPHDRLVAITEIERRMRDSLAEILRAGVDRGEFTGGDLRFRAHVIQTLLQSWATRRWVLEKDVDIRRFLEMSQRAILAVLRAPEGAPGS